MSTQEIKKLTQKLPILKEIIALKPVTWLNPDKKTKATTPDFSIGKQDMLEAAKLWERFAPFFEKAFPETKTTKGKLESPLRKITKMQNLLEQESGEFQGELFLKCDNALPIAGSIKARGGFYEVLHHAEELALKEGLLNPNDNYSVFTQQKFKDFFSQYEIGVGSTGNLGLSIGIISAKLGFKVNVYVSADAKKWKKDLLRSKGVNVIEFAGDFSEAINSGREQTKINPKAYFVDDENSKHLFLGYTVGALRLAQQLEKANIKVNAENPLFIYSPCGVGGSPGGIAFGLKQIYGDAVHCFFVEPTHSPAVLTGLATKKMSNISVQDLGIDNKTEADGLAVGRPSKFATAISEHLISGIYTLEDEKLYSLLTKLLDTENIFLEPSATAGLIGPQRIAATNYAQENKLNMENATHIAWATGGDLVPEDQRNAFYKRGLQLIE